MANGLRHAIGPVYSYTKFITVWQNLLAKQVTLPHISSFHPLTSLKFKLQQQLEFSLELKVFKSSIETLLCLMVYCVLKVLHLKYI